MTNADKNNSQNIAKKEPEKQVLGSEELKRLTDFFSILISVDQRLKGNKTYGRFS